jgi:hypothetical protein
VSNAWSDTTYGTNFYHKESLRDTSIIFVRFAHYHAVRDWQALSGYGVVLFICTSRQACIISCITL